jgi:predicted SAM-dependent methyltransferase
MTMSRSATLRLMFKTAGKGLEIGPSHSPLMPKADGFDVETLDYLDAEGLRSKYAAAGIDVSAVEEVDYVADGRPMTEVVGDRHRYDWIVASHVLEHVPDLLGFLRDCEALLKPRGSLVLAIPDKRCCFDILRPVSTVGQVLQAHVDSRKRPPPGVIFDDIAYARKRNGRIGWIMGEQEPLEEVRPIEEAWQVFEQARTNNSYIDMHCWVFVPSSFRLVIKTLAACGMIGLRELSFQVGQGEFYAVLSTEALPAALDLGALALAAQAEEHEAYPGPSHASTHALLFVSQMENARLRRDLASAQAALSAAVERASAEAQRVSAITASTSWQLTAPLRALRRMIKMHPPPRLSRSRGA